MNELDDLESQYPRARRLLVNISASLVELGGHSTINSLGLRTAAILCADQPMIVLRLDSLEAALEGFRDTGTWGDYFPETDDTRR